MNFTERQLKIVEFCAAECERQQSGEMSVFRMVKAYSIAYEWDREISIGLIEQIAFAIDPVKNRNGVRNVPVMVGGRAINTNRETIDRQIERLLDNQTWILPEEFYKEFEEIHPFVDGNGRTGAILYNLLSGTLDEPFAPPNFWKPTSEKGTQTSAVFASGRSNCR